ncbi:unnamed protein product, partial [Mesorhabditis spiculigera]
MPRCALHLFIYLCVVLSILALVQISLFSYGSPDADRYEVHDGEKPNDSVHFELKKHRLPKCLIIGARKGGTRALVDSLALHPMIKAARREVHFFDRNDTFARGIDWYKEQLPLSFAHEVTIEKTPAYFPSLIAPRRVYEMDPKMKILLILREPVVRTISDFTQVYYNRLELDKSLPQFEDVIFQNGTNRLATNYKPLRNSLYVIHLRNWLKYFPLSQIHVVDGDKFAMEPLPELRAIEKFLGLPSQIEAASLVWDPHKGFFCFRRSLGRAVHCLGDSKGRAHRPVSPATREKMRIQLLPYNSKLFELLGRRFRW